ncbi:MULTISPECIES: hypothetical protein [Streptomyces]|uniref:Uncharacterized protein n=1 Tax=Streptomyces bottropensis ATCC 25435 TaxID=1054862 RepID=M3DMF3_9ACTN|nr:MULTISPECIES: hypothetical protein [Streptomyces]EMF58117.1 hypothetical protein SBD_0789 [Streptomyces bottropensis ATCC 25435]MZD18604.1 hypothetical protein [Streptomyces sp. SID5476]
MTTSDARDLEALGLAVAPREDPLSYPGAWPATSGLLDGSRMLPLDTLVFEDRVPVLSVGSNACPAQLVHKMAEHGVRCRIPMVRARVTDIGIGVSAHVSLLGYVSASPFHSPGSTADLFLTWLDEAQLAVVDASEGADSPTGNFRRALLPASDFRVELESGEALDHAWIYVNRWGVLRDGGPGPRPHPGRQRPLIGELLAASAELRALFGTTPDEFCALARGDRGRCVRGRELFAEHGWTTVSGLESYVRPHPGA